MDALLAWNNERFRPDSGSGDAMHEEVWLLGQPPLNKYLDFVVEMTAGGGRIPRADIVAEWREANDHYATLESQEAGVADQAVINELDPSLGALAEDVLADPRYMRGFDSLPTRIAMVELDRLVVSQPHVNLLHTERLKTQLGAAPTPESLFRFCLPLDRPEAPVRMRRAGENRFIFWSESSDFRFHEPSLIQPDQITSQGHFGPLGGVIGLMVGYGSNFLNVIDFSISSCMLE